MKNNLQILILAATVMMAAGRVSAQEPSVSVTDKVICGYQGWFSCYGDGSPLARWFHWSVGQYLSNTGRPAAGHLTFEVYPDISVYKPSSLFQTGFANLGDGRPAKLFSSWLPDVIDTHFSLMEKHGIDGVGLQRFIGGMEDGVVLANHDSLSARVRRAAEKHKRVFYMMYDVSGLAEDKFNNIKSDWIYEIVTKLRLTSSPMYARENSKPVVCIWGFGFTDRTGTPEKCLEVINWLKAQGCFVIGGVPTHWRTGTNDSKPGFINVYAAFDMISPWMVGRFDNNDGADWFRANVITQDISWCEARGIKYQPVVFPGFSWSNWNTGRQNHIPRSKGEFFWHQIRNVKELGLKNAYVAMFDEYDEGTAIMSLADSYYDIPTDQYFLTASADSTYVSSDFYLRLTGKATRVIKGLDPVTPTVSIPLSKGPVWFRTSLERKFDAMPDWISSPDPTAPVTNVTGYGGTGSPSLAAVRENPHIGAYSLKFTGRDNSKVNSICYFRAFEVNIPVGSNTNISFWTFPKDSLARHISVDLIMTDGTTLRDAGATDVNGAHMHPGSGRGAINAWSQTTCNIGKWLNGKTIDRIMVAYDMGPQTGDFCAYLDDIAVFTGEVFSAVNEAASGQGLPVRIYPNPATGGRVSVDLGSLGSEPNLEITVTDLLGQVEHRGTVTSRPVHSLTLSTIKKGVHLVTVSGKNRSFTSKLIVLD